MTTPGIRRVVTGFGPDGRARVVSDERIAASQPEQWSIWAADNVIQLPGDGTAPPFRGPLLPAPGGFHITVFTLPPHFDPDALFDTDDIAEREAAFTASIDREAHPILPDPNPYGYGTVRGTSILHANAAVDCLMQISGETVFVLEDTEILLQQGDWIIINGVTHACRNDLAEPSLLLGVVIGACHNGIPLRHPDSTAQIPGTD
ncbi:hypothetical protein [Nocardia sp. BMG51109]|uniref:hypothetical protein n=1 Tax=Nocardia sp. BMG51109 TaxID=1056816 RepID=UPI0004B45691|nr:hypothetical protein [Nocardia sp. BMG51109]